MQAVQGLVLGDNPAVLVTSIDDLDQAGHDLEYLVVGNNHQRVKGREEAPIGGLLAA